MPCSSLPSGSRTIAVYVQWLQKLRYGIIVLWVAALIPAAIFVMNYVKATSQEFSPPAGSQSATAENVFALDFPQLSGVSYFNVFLQRSAGVATDITEIPQVRNFTLTVTTAFQEYFGLSNIAQLVSFYELETLNMPLAARNLIAPDNSSMTMPLVLRADFVSSQAGTWGNDMQTIVDNHAYLLEGFASAACNGLPLFIAEIVSNTEKELGIMDAVAIPVAMLIMSVTMKSLRLMILPLLTIGLTLCISFGAMYGITELMAVSSTTPSLMMSMCVAMAIDYNLFLLSRYKEALLHRDTGTRAIETMLIHAGHTVFISGFTLLLCLLGLIFFPLNMLQSFGIGCGLTITVALLVSLNLVPTMLLTFPNFFERCAQPTQFPSFVPLWFVNFCNEGHLQSFQEVRTSGVYNETESTNLLTNRDRSTIPDADAASVIKNPMEEIETERMESVFRHVRYILQFPWNLITVLLVVALALGLGSTLLQFRTTDTMDGYLPRGTPVFDNFQRFVQTFGFGYTQPYHIILSQRGNAPLNVTLPTSSSAPFFLYFQGYLQRVTEDWSVAPTAVGDFTGPLNLGSNFIRYSEFHACLPASFNASSCVPDTAGLILGMLSTVPNVQSMYNILISRIDPMGNLGDRYYHMLQDVGKQFRNEVLAHSERFANPTYNVTADDMVAMATYFQLYFTGVGPSAMDAIDNIYSVFPIIIGISGGAVLLVVGVAFRSVMVALRSVFSIAVTELFVFGMVLVTYQEPGIFNWTTWGSLTSSGAITWTCPIVAFSVIVGVALDYDIFLLTRVIEIVQSEEREARDAVLHALCCTGKIITAAGIIMAVAFFGLLLSATPILNMLGFFITVAVLFDTFIVRVFFVPSLMSLFGKWNWWPRRLGESTDGDTQRFVAQYGTHVTTLEE